METGNIRQRIVWPILAGCTVCGLWIWAACGGGTIQNPSIPPSTEVIDDDDYYDPPQPDGDPATLVPTEGVSATTSDDDSSEEDSLPPEDDDTSLSEPTPNQPPNWNVDGTVYLGDSLNLYQLPIRITFFSQSQLNDANRPIDINNFSMDFSAQPPLTFPVEFRTMIVEGNEYVARAWQDINENQQQDAGDFIGDSERFPATSDPTSISLILKMYVP